MKGAKSDRAASGEIAEGRKLGMESLIGYGRIAGGAGGMSMDDCQ